MNKELLKTITENGLKSEIWYYPGLNMIEFIADADIDSDGGPNIDNDKYWSANTTLRFKGKSVNAQEVPYGVIPLGILDYVRGVGLGCRMVITNTRTKESCEAVLADLGPTFKIGEISPACARNISVNPNSVYGGEERAIIKYQCFLDIAASVKVGPKGGPFVSTTFNLQHLHG